MIKIFSSRNANAEHYRVNTNMGMSTMTPWLLLFSRTLLFAVFQIVIAGFLMLFGATAPWDNSSAWWTISALLANIISILLLIRLARKENRYYFDFIPLSRQIGWRDAGIVFVLMLMFIPIAVFPNMWLAQMVFGSGEIGFSLLFRPLPLWAKIVSILFPFTIAFAELPTYFSYVMPRLEKQLRNDWLAWGLASFFLAFQHITLPLILDGRFILWRFGMFIPLSFLMGLCLKLRPGLFPHLMVVHFILDLTTVIMMLTQ